jgi:hypothetical protein
VLRDDVGDEVADANASREPRRRLGVPERVVATERRAVRSAKGLDSLAVVEAARATAGLGGIPLARVLRDDVVEVRPAQACISTRTWPASVARQHSRVSVLHPSLVLRVGLVGAAEVERRALARGDLRQDGAEVEGARRSVACRFTMVSVGSLVWYAPIAYRCRSEARPSAPQGRARRGQRGGRS